MASKKTAVFLQNACLQHRYLRSQDLSNIVERPERLRAVTIGLSAAIAQLEGLLELTKSKHATFEVDPANDLAAALDKMNLGSTSMTPKISIIQSKATVDLLRHAAVKFIHGDIDRDVYLESLQNWAEESLGKISQGQSEMPEGYSQGDLYLCPESLIAIQGAVGTVCEAVDAVISSSIDRAFVAIRPPGHHCGEDTPSGFCFINNVAVAAAHAHLQHGIKRVVIFDIDLHHGRKHISDGVDFYNVNIPICEGNGTQSLVWQINEETYRQKLEQEAGAPATKPGPQFYYGSLHDILSYPCEDGKTDLIQAASTSIHDAHGQFIENVHLQTYTSEEHFWTELYQKKYKKLLHRAEEFLDATGGPGEDVLFFISCGMDACEHEYESMSRHNRKVPTTFYYQFARDACALSDKYAQGRVISVLEGGYSDRALTSGSMAHLVGLNDLPGSLKADESWWSVENLIELEKATKKRRGGRPSLQAPGASRQWIERTLSIFAPLDSAAASVMASLRAAPISMTLRDRSKTSKASSPSPPPSRLKAGGAPGRKKAEASKAGSVLDTPVIIEAVTSTGSNEEESSGAGQKKLPRVILKLGPRVKI